MLSIPKMFVKILSSSFENLSYNIIIEKNRWNEGGNVLASANEVLSPTLLAKEKLIGYRDKEPNNALYNAAINIKNEAIRLLALA